MIQPLKSPSTTYFRRAVLANGDLFHSPPFSLCPSVPVKGSCLPILAGPHRAMRVHFSTLSPNTNGIRALLVKPGEDLGQPLYATAAGRKGAVGSEVVTERFRRQSYR